MSVQDIAAKQTGSEVVMVVVDTVKEEENMQNEVMALTQPKMACPTMRSVG